MREGRDPLLLALQRKGVMSQGMHQETGTCPVPQEFSQSPSEPGDDALRAFR